MITPKEYPSSDVLERVAEDFRKRGYRVVVSPRDNELPEFLRDVTPDLIAEREGEHVVVEVKRSPSEIDRFQFDSISKRIADNPGWRFVVMASAPDVRSDELLLDEQAIQKQLGEANSLLESGYSRAALLLTWASVEALLRLIVNREGLPTAGADPAVLMRRAASEGFIGSDEFTTLNTAYKLRSAVVHGFGWEASDPSVDADRVARNLSRISASLLKELRNSAQ